MVFHSLQFLVFLLVAFALYWNLKQREAQKWLLLVVSAVFYCVTAPLQFILILYCATSDYFIARAIGRSDDPKKRKLLVTLSVAANLTILGFFKYSSLLIETISDGLRLLSPNVATGFLAVVAKVVGLIGIDMSGPRLMIVLPLGLSFVVFQTISYTVDVYRGHVKARDKWVDVALYVCFFPKITAGPIVRPPDFMPQLDKPAVLSDGDGAKALLRIAKGLVKKLLIADFLSANLVGRVFTSPHLYSPIEVWAGVFGYTLQIYYDFSAYSDIAIGIAGLFGIKFKENFNRPYKAMSLPDFWRRWHISLSNWLRDYIYIPLGGNRDGMLHTVRNVMITMILGGIWHGANWRMALWGLVHGVGLSLTRIIWSKTGMPTGAEPIWRKAIAWSLTFLSVMLARIYFRAESMPAAHAVFAGLVGKGLEAPNLTPQILLVLAIAAGIHFGPSNLYDRAAAFFVKAPIPVRALALLAIALVVKSLASFDVQPFIYTKF